jgi:MtaA/CmuA family methyltransferase
VQEGIDRISVDPDVKFEACRRYYERVDSDVLFFFSDIAIQAEIMGAPAHLPADGMPSISGPASLIRTPPVSRCPRMQVNIRTTSRLVRHFPEKPVAALIYGPFTVAGQLAREQRLLKDVIQHPQDVCTILEKAFAMACSYAGELLSAGAGILWISDPLAALLPPEKFWQFAGRFLADLRHRHAAPPSIVHICGDTQAVLPQILETGITGISFDQCMDLLLAEETVPPEVFLIGNLDPSEGVEQSRPEEIKAAVRDLAHLMGSHANYVMSTGCALPPATPVENAAAFVEAAKHEMKGIAGHADSLFLLGRAVFEGDAAEARNRTAFAIEREMPVSTLINAGLMRGIRKASTFYDAKQRFLPDILLATEAFYTGYEKLSPWIPEEPGKRADMVIGTVKGDFHEIGKDIVRIMLEVHGFTVVDLGVDVPPEAFIKAAQKSGARIIGLSAFITSARCQLRAVTAMLEKEQIGDIRVIVGGAAATRGIAADIGADGYAENAVDAARLVGRLLASKDGPFLSTRP